MAFEQRGIFIVPHLLWHWTSFLVVSSVVRSHLVTFYIKQRNILITCSNLEPHENDCLYSTSRASDIWMPDFRMLKHPHSFSWVPEQNFFIALFCLIYQKCCVLNQMVLFYHKMHFYIIFFPNVFTPVTVQPTDQLLDHLHMAFKTVLPSKMFSNSWMAAIRTWNCFLLRSNC